MAQQTSRFATLKIGDKSYTVVFSILAIVSLRDRWNLESDDEVLARLDQIAQASKAGKIDFKSIGDLMWAGLRRHHPDVTTDDCVVLMDELGLEGLPGFMTAIFGTIAASAPPQGVRQARPPKKANGRLPSTS